MNLLVTGAWKDAPAQLEALRSLGHSVVFQQNESDSLACAYESVEGVICNGLFLHHSFERFPKLRYIQLTSAGFDRVPMDYAKAHGILVHNARGVYSIPMAEFAIGGVLQLYKESRRFCESQRAHRWEKRRTLLELAGKTVSIVGCGNVGTRCATHFAAFGCRVLGVDPFPVTASVYEELYPLEALDFVLSTSDIVVLTLPLTEQTRNLMNAERFAAMKKGAILVNIARGAVVEPSALIDALHDRLFGAVLDVFEEEPLPASSPLWDMEQVILTPHNSFVGDGNDGRLSAVIIENLRCANHCMRGISK